MWHHFVLRLHAFVFSWRHLWSEELLCLFLVLFVIAIPGSEALRLSERGLFMQNTQPNATTSYRLSFRYMSPDPVGSVDMLFCSSPIPEEPCIVPAGLDASNAVLSAQSGETGFSISSRSSNHLVLSRSPTMMYGDSPLSSYTFDGIKNPSSSDRAFAIRLRTHASTNATGSQIDFGSVRGQATVGITLQTQVPPMLIFCLAEVVLDDCAGTNDNYYTDMGDLNSNSTLTTQSQMGVGTNASGGFAITINGTPPAAGTNVIDAPKTPTESTPGKNQFGINLVANNQPTVGSDPEGIWANAVPSTDYGIPNKYKFVSGDVVAYSPNVSLMRKFTVSYILNSSPNLRAGVYSTTVTFIASGRF